MVAQAVLVAHAAAGELVGRGGDPVAVLAHARLRHRRDARPVVVDARRLGELGEAAVALRVRDDRPERDVVEEVLEPAAAREREPRRANGERRHPEARVGGEEDVTRLDERELLGEREVERVERRGRVRAQRGQLVAPERGRAALVGAQLADEHALEPGQRIEDQLPRAQRRVQRAVGGAARGHERERGEVLSEPLACGGARGGRQFEPQRRVRRVRERREAGHAPPPRCAEMRVARGVVVAHPREQLELSRLVAAGVVGDVRPVARHGGERRRRVGARLEDRVPDRVRAADGGHVGRELDRRRRVERDRDLEPRVGGVVAVGVVERLDRVPDGVRVEEVDEQALHHRREWVPRARCAPSR